MKKYTVKYKEKQMEVQHTIFATTKQKIANNNLYNKDTTKMAVQKI